MAPRHIVPSATPIQLLTAVPTSAPPSAIPSRHELVGALRVCPGGAAAAISSRSSASLGLTGRDVAHSEFWPELRPRQKRASSPAGAPAKRLESEGFTIFLGLLAPRRQKDIRLHHKSNMRNVTLRGRIFPNQRNARSRARIFQKFRNAPLRGAYIPKTA